MGTRRKTWGTAERDIHGEIQRSKIFFASGLTDEGEQFKKRLRARFADDAIDEASRLSYEKTGCQIVDVSDANGQEIATSIDLNY